MSLQHIFSRPKLLPLEQPDFCENSSNSVHTIPKELKTETEITLVINEEEVGPVFYSLVGKTIVVRKELGGTAQCIMHINDFNIKRTNELIICLTAPDTSIEFKFQTEQDCDRLYTSVQGYIELEYASKCTLNTVVTPNSESFCAYGSTTSCTNNIYRSRSFDQLETEHVYQAVLSPTYYYPQVRAMTQNLESSRKPSRGNCAMSLNPISALKSLAMKMSQTEPKQNSSTPLREVDKGMQQDLSSPVYEYVSVVPIGRERLLSDTADND